jgi:hypothetical protein
MQSDQGGGMILILTLVVGVLLLRAAAWRATVSFKTLAYFTVLGAAYAVFWNPVVMHAINPLYESGVVLQLASALALQLLLLAPFALYLLRRGGMNRLSVADLWLLGFFTGFGHDMAAEALIATSRWHDLEAMAKFVWLPPLAIGAENYASPGYGYWTALIAVVVAVVLRMTGNRIVAWCFGLAAALITACDAPLYFGSEPNMLQRAMAVVGLHGHLLSWLSLAALIGAQLFEGIWLKKRIAHSVVEPPLSTFFGKLQTGNLSAAAAAWKEIASARRAQIESASGGAPEIWSPENSSPVSIPIWKMPLLWSAIAWVYLLALLFSPTLRGFIGTRAVLDYQGFLQLTPVNIIMAAVIVLTYLNAGWVATDGDDEDWMRLKTEWAMLRLAFWALMVTVVAVSWNGFYGFVNAIVSPGNLGLPQLYDSELGTLALGFGVALCAPSWGRIIRWRAVQADLRHRVMANRFFAALCCVLLSRVSFTNFLGRYEDFHQAHGVTAFNISQFVGTNGNKIAAWWFINLSLLRILPLAALIWFVSWRVGKWFQGSTPGTMERAGIMAAVVGVIAWISSGHVFAGSCMTANDCICYPPGANPAIGAPPPVLVFTPMDNKSHPPSHDKGVPNKLWPEKQGPGGSPPPPQPFGPNDDLSGYPGAKHHPSTEDPGLPRKFSR